MDKKYDCSACHGDCCNSTALTSEEVRSREYEMRKVFTPEAGEGFWILKTLYDGKCVYLNRENWKCNIYERRPRLCREGGCEPVEEFNHGL